MMISLGLAPALSLTGGTACEVNFGSKPFVSFTPQDWKSLETVQVREKKYKVHAHALTHTYICTHVHAHTQACTHKITHVHKHIGRKPFAIGVFLMGKKPIL